MAIIQLQTKYFVKLALTIKTIATKPAGVALSFPLIGVVYVTDMQRCLYLLLGLFIADFATGIIASWVEKKKAEKKNPKLKEQNLISSEKLKMSAVKAATYSFSILGVYGIERIFFIKTLRFDAVSDRDLTITIIFTAFCCAIEFYSIVFENFKRMGFDIAKKFTVMVTGIKKLIQTVKKEE